MASAATQQQQPMPQVALQQQVRGLSTATASVQNAPTTSVQQFVHLWPPANLPTSYSTSHVLHSFIDSLTSSPSLIQQYRRGAILVVGSETVGVSKDLMSSVSQLSSVLSLPVYFHTSATQQLQEAVLQANTNSSAQQQQLPQETHQQNRLQHQESIPDWMLIVDPSQGIGCMSLTRATGESKITNGGVVRMQLIDYKRKGEHGFDESSPIVQACFPSPPSADPDQVKCEIVDLTMGLGVDSFVLASFGATVTMIEREPIFALLMLDALHMVSTAPKHSHPIMQQRIEEVSEVASRLRLVLGESSSYLQSLATQSAEQQQPQVLYVDPFYPEPPPSELAKLQESMSGKAVKLQKSITAAKSKKGIELARLIWKETQPLDTTNSSSSVDVPVTEAGFHASPTNLALYSLLSSALNVGSSNTRVVLKQPSTPYARRLLTRQMGFEFTKTFQVRDTAFHILGHKQVKQPKSEADDAAASSSDAKSSSPKPAKKTAANKKKHNSRSSSPDSSNTHRRSFHSSSIIASPSSIPSASPLPASSTGYYFEPIGHIRTVFIEKFSIPRQSSLAPSARAVLTLTPETARKFKVDSWNKSVQNLDTFSHAWLIFVFHQHHEPQAAARQSPGSDVDASPTFQSASSSEMPAANNPRAPDEYVWNETVRPPRLGGDVRVGVFASRSPYRPNPIGMSCVRIEKVVMSEADGNAEVHFSGVDLLDGTPILDIKPWISYCDGMKSTPEYPLRLGWAEQPVKRWNVKWMPEASELVDRFQREIDAQDAATTASSSSSSATPVIPVAPPTETIPRTPIRSLVEDLLSLDPRHGYQQKSHPVDALKSAGRSYGFRVTDWNIAYEMDGQGTFIVKHIETMEEFKKKHAERVKRAEDYARKMNL